MKACAGSEASRLEAARPAGEDKYLTVGSTRKVQLAFYIHIGSHSFRAPNRCLVHQAAAYEAEAEAKESIPIQCRACPRAA